MAHLDRTGTSERLAGVLDAPLRAAGLDLDSVEVTPAGKRRLVRVAVDTLDPDQGVTLDEIGEATREVSRVLDETDVMGEQPYTLEVTSPGVDRPLTRPRHWRRNRGRLVRVRLREGEDLTGRVAEADEDRVVLDLDGGSREIALAQVDRATVQVELNRKGS